ncbi:MAG: peroxiredoxin-like family protein [Anaerolineae bacterium]
MTELTLHRLQPGIAAPMFAASDAFGSSITLSDYKGRALLLSFFRNAACAICNLRVHQLIQRYPALHAAGLEIVAVFEATPESIRQYVGQQDAPFPIIADANAALYQLYGVETSEAKVQASMSTEVTQTAVRSAAEVGFALTREENTNFYRMPADFLITPDQTIARAFYSDVIGDHLPFGEIEAFAGLEQLSR